MRWFDICVVEMISVPYNGMGGMELLEVLDYIALIMENVHQRFRLVLRSVHVPCPLHTTVRDVKQKYHGSLVRAQPRGRGQMERAPPGAPRARVVDTPPRSTPTPKALTGSTNVRLLPTPPATTPRFEKR